MTSVNSSRSTTSTRHLENLPIDPPGAALRGATLAFRKLSAKPNHLPKTYSGTNGALAAASTVGRGWTPSDSKRLSSSPQTSLETTPARSQDTGSSYGLNAKTPALRSPKNPTLPEGLNADCSRSPSNIAAALAAARASPSLSNASVATPHFYRRFSEQEHNTVSVSERSNEQATLRAKTRSRAPTVSSNDDSAPDFNSKMSSSRSSQTLDLTPIAPTNTLVTMFERNNVGGSGLGAETLPEVQSQTERFPIRSPKPLRPHSMNSPAALFPKTALKSDPYQSSLSSILDPGRERASYRASEEQEVSRRGNPRHLPNTAPLPVSVVPDVRLRRPLSRARSDKLLADHPLKSPYTSASELRPKPAPQQTATKYTEASVRGKDLPSRTVGTSTYTTQTLHSTTEHPKLSMPPPPELSVSPSPSIAASYRQLYSRRVTPHMTGDSLANAIVASTLASSRVPSPSISHSKPLPMEPRRRPQNHPHEKHHKSHHLFRNSRTPSPAKKGMRHTMRKEPSSSDSEDEGPYQKHKKKRLMRKHPNKHHEGDRKRWRDAITERERKRYEGVWAANRGLHIVLEEAGLQTPAVANMANEQVCSLVVRDIWSRSRLPEHVLEEVWDLVDTQGLGRLSKEEFVVGMWLIDQCLKGRKLPIKVSDSVWGSVRIVGGIKVRRK